MVWMILSLWLDPTLASPFRVQVFPHRGSYTTPQGKDSVISRVKIETTGLCHQYQAGLNAQNDWEKTGNLISSQSSYALSTGQSGATSTFYFECDRPFKVVRAAGLTSYSYSGDFVAVIRDSSPLIQIINLVEPEDYLQGVVPSEVGGGWPMEALKAQAVAARTYAWWTVLDARNSSPSATYDLVDTVQHQVYLGVGVHTSATDAAVWSTAKQIMTYQGAVIKSYFSADSGGVTQSAEDGFGQQLPYCTSKKELYDLSKVKSAWKTDLSLKAIGNAFGRKLAAVEIVERDASGRVKSMSLITSQNERVPVSGVDFRLTLKLRSTLFDLQTAQVGAEAGVSLSGRGYGHGVGMAQVGAKEYANQLGWSFDQILKFYYTGIVLETVANAYIQ